MAKPPAALIAFAGNVRNERQSRGLTQEQLSHACGITTGEISRLERALREPRLLTVVRLAEGLGLTPSQLLQGVDARS